MQPISEILHYKVSTEDAAPAVTPMFQCSAFAAGSSYFYSRKNNPNVVEFEEIILRLEQAKYGVAFATGMSAIYTTLMLLQPGSTILINKFIYGCSYKLLQKVSHKYGHTLLIKDLSEKENIKNITEKVDLVFFETPTNPFLKTIDIAEVANAIKSNNEQALVVVDNTWATPVCQKPLEFGADISLYSCTKYFSGHSDVMGGIILLNNPSLYDDIIDQRFYAGNILTPYAAWLLRRSMQTFDIRMRRHNETTIEMLSFLRTLPVIKKIYYPKIDGKQLVNYGGIIFIELQDSLVDKYIELTNTLKLFQTGTGMACVTSMIAQPYTGSHASMNKTEKEKMGLTKALVRLCFGMEEPADLKNDLINAFTIIQTHAKQDWETTV